MIKLNEYASNLYNVKLGGYVFIVAPSKKEAKTIFKDTIFKDVKIGNKQGERTMFYDTWEQVRDKQRKILLQYYMNYDIRGE